MAKKAQRDPFVSLYVDRHGRERCRFRRRGFSCPLPHPSTREYKEAYRRALASLPPEPVETASRTINDLLPRFYGSIGFKKGGDAWRAIRRQLLESFREEYGRDPVAAFRTKDIEVILSNKMEKRRVGNRTVGGTAAAARLREQLDLLFRFAIKLEWIERNPVTDAEQVEHSGPGFYPWTEEDIAKFREHWKLGTKPRLAMEMVLWTGQRRSDVHRATTPKGGRIAFTAKKTGKDQSLPVAPALNEAIKAMPAVGLTTLLVTDYGKPFASPASFGNWFKDKCEKAGLPQCTLHGLRKALARRAADQGATQQGLKALGQWSGDREVALYVAGANQRRLAAGALDAVVAWEQEVSEAGTGKNIV
jgi:integrase